MSPIQNPLPPAFDPAQAALAALARAGLRAAEDAQRANTHMVLAENGQVVHVSPQTYLRMRAEQEALNNRGHKKLGLDSNFNQAC